MHSTVLPLHTGCGYGVIQGYPDTTILATPNPGVTPYVPVYAVYTVLYRVYALYCTLSTLYALYHVLCTHCTHRWLTPVCMVPYVVLSRTCTVSCPTLYHTGYLPYCIVVDTLHTQCPTVYCIQGDTVCSTVSLQYSVEGYTVYSTDTTIYRDTPTTP